jgi:putative ABC transport system substrate-binding protein
MRRRDFITLIGTAAAAWPFAARAQQTEKPVIGFLDGRLPDALANRLRGFHRGLREAGYVEGENVTVLYRCAENQIDRLPALADELTRRPVAVIVASGGPNVISAAKKATTTIPIVSSAVKIQPSLGSLRSWRAPEAT